MDYSRPYRSKRHPPCDQCRRKKLRCDRNAGTICQRCQQRNTPCSFNQYQPSEPSPSTVLPGSVPPVPELAPTPAPAPAPAPVPPVFSGSPLFPIGTPIDLPFNTEATPGRFGQTVQTLDQLPGLSTQVIGASGESDPWLLRHCRFDDRGFLRFHQVHFRNAGGVPLDEKIPVHFLVTVEGLYDASKQATGFPKRALIREELESLFPLECGQRLVALFVKFVYPTLPVISRSQIGISPSQPIPDQQILRNTPVHLLAAIYASAQPFAKFDEYLCFVNAYTQPPTDQLWRMVLELLLEEIHTPHLSVMQAGLLYLHKPLKNNERALADSPFIWSFVGLLVGLATSLGLTLECRPMGLPAWEKRLRRRLWWAIYSEDKWRSLLMGRPPYIRHDEWDVTDLDDQDFILDRSSDDQAQQAGLPFQQFSRLSCKSNADSSLRLSQRLSSNFSESLHVARALLQKLKDWYSVLPPQLKSQTGHFTIDDPTPKCTSTSLHFAYILLEIFIFRALLRPLVRSATPPPLFEEGTEPLPTMEMHDPESFNLVDDYISEIVEAEEIEPVPAIEMTRETGIGTVKAAENCAAIMLRLVMRMVCSDLAGFWYSWSRIGFATVSSFMLILVVQAPSRDHAIRARRLVYMWRQALRSQSKGCNLMDLALVRLDGIHWTGLSRNFYLPRHVEEALNTD
ncbi:Zn(II)2Cys6 transcription factor [Aspergillus glaucus CBS 516.65]|uniref:Zn(2)-C6 fungal-type domain-containing protein n=1 Tax=Aspergillus glaucus CBS 516.65 TaxID=1160497 RepID=A0A1L9VWW6_ASPGL|nr:hypothetical protein ASPGLDRAFT_116622 [Aspergillus glaucus CBS 516.65]OJJ88404.1 hypothetical protein ASPGLDRAFT_116622 [Aspergillus glaucus CBS 516.65]